LGIHLGGASLSIIMLIATTKTSEISRKGKLLVAEAIKIIQSFEVFYARYFEEGNKRNLSKTMACRSL
jgi:hypothetical protein